MNKYSSAFLRFYCDICKGSAAPQAAGCFQCMWWLLLDSLPFKEGLTCRAKFNSYLNAICASCVPPPKIIFSGRRILITLLTWKEDLGIIADDVHNDACSGKERAAASWSSRCFLDRFLHWTEHRAHLTWKSLCFSACGTARSEPGLCQLSLLSRVGGHKGSCTFSCELKPGALGV